MLNVWDLTGGVINAATLQAAIDQATAIRETLFFPRGVYTTTTLNLPSDASLLLAEDAIVRASPEPQDWQACNGRPLISAEGACRISITGGTFCGGGDVYVDERGKWSTAPLRPGGIIKLRDCQDITIRDVTLSQTVTWTCHLDNCERATLDGVTIRNPIWNKSENSDGIDINGCRHVTVRYCDVETGDDGICLKNARGSEVRADMYDVHVHDCRVATTCNPTKIGTETYGNIYDVTFERITVERHPDITADGPGAPTRVMINPLSAISVQSNDGASVHDITFRDYRVKHALAPVMMVLQPRNRFAPDVRGEMYNVTVENVVVKTTYRNSAVLAAEGMRIKNVRIAGLCATNYELPSETYVATVPNGKQYPDAFHFPPFPSFGLFTRNADVTLENCTFCEVTSSGRPMLDMK